ncbi:hypothetical protein [Sulfurimonas sp.]|uniref:hypothetical protein n=1 Tax=Sulfurimonas sp. TaxID=2022749 RepID=UPI0025F515A0|nr:hypothetical protein [Sulfurimonas sp.]
MRVDLDFFGSLLNVFLESEKAHVDFNDITNAGVETEIDGEISEKLVFHLQLALDNQLIGKRSGFAYNLKDIGIIQSLDGLTSIFAIPLRLTQDGHDFALSLNNKEVMKKLKTEFKDAPFKVVFEGGQKLLQHFMKKKLESIIE